jgi:hypothetical protein
VASGATYQFSSLAFVDADHGLMGGENGVLSACDGGANVGGEE